MRDEVKVQHHIRLLRRALSHVEEQLDLLVTSIAVEEAHEERDEYGGVQECGENYSGLNDE